jgi:hypothetical protein
LPRLADVSVLEETIRSGVNSAEYFAVAAALDGGRYIDLKFNQPVNSIESSGLLVKTDIVQNQLSAELKHLDLQNVAAHGTHPYQQDVSQSQKTGGDQGYATEIPASEMPANRRFYMTARLDNTRINRDVQRLMEEVIGHLTTVDGSQTEILLEVNVTSPNDLPSQVVRTVSENCCTLKVQDCGFEE